jgi:predicted DNA-binding transcriptional regulator AlpA
VSPEEIDALAEAVSNRVVARIRAEPAAPPSEPGLVDAAALAARLGVSRSWVYEHASELRAVRLGSGKRARLRFDMGEAVKAHASAPRCTAPAAPQAAKRRPRRAASSGELLPIRAARATPTGLKESHDAA